MTTENLVNGEQDVLTGAQSLVEEFAAIKPHLPTNWLELILAPMPPDFPMKIKKLIDRLNRIYLLRTAPTLDELKLFRAIAQKPH